MDILNIQLKQVVPGMILAEDVYTPSREKILLRNTIITAKTIAKLRVHNINTLTVYIPKSVADEQDDEQFEHLNKTKNSLEFKKFRKTYLSTTAELKDMYHQAVSDPKYVVTEEMLLSVISEVLECSTNSISTFEMLQCMRDYDDITFIHSLNTALISRALAKWAGFNSRDIELVTIAGLLHDIGKLLIPDEIIKKPGKLSDDEYALVKTHPTLGYNSIESLELDDRIKEAVLMHHERLNGSGYPAGLSGNAIPAFARIVAIADVYDAMTATRSYRQAICPFDVVESFEKDGYEKFDVGYLLVFLQNLVQSYIHAPVLLSNSLTGEVVMINKDKLSRPVVNVNGEFFDLSKLPDLRIKKLI